jgi:hypothetical protein
MKLFLRQQCKDKCIVHWKKIIRLGDKLAIFLDKRQISTL